jgi:hypothetical protein
MMPRLRLGANWCAIAAGAALSEWRVIRSKRIRSNIPELDLTDRTSRMAQSRCE